MTLARIFALTVSAAPPLDGGALDGDELTGAEGAPLDTEAPASSCDDGGVPSAAVGVASGDEPAPGDAPPALLMSCCDSIASRLQRTARRENSEYWRYIDRKNAEAADNTVDTGILAASVVAPEIKLEESASAAVDAAATSDVPLICPCFSSDTTVLTADGPRPIGEVRAGDLVWSADPETGARELRRVIRRYVTPERELIAVKVENAQGVAELTHPLVS